MENMLIRLKLSKPINHTRDLGLFKKSKSINHKGAQALRNSPVGYFSAVARLQGRRITQRSQRDEILYFNFVLFVPTLCSLWLRRAFSTTPKSFYNCHFFQQITGSCKFVD